jgi:uncharacterized protein YdeI (YjbR/CyaY-like superfamily)
MARTDPRVDAYIARAAPFAQPILRHVRALVHRAAPDIEEGIKWGMPSFMLGGKNLAGMAAFKAHCAVTVHGAGQMCELSGSGQGMGNCGKIAALADLPPDDVLIAALREAAQRIVSGVKAPRAGKAPRVELAMPEDFAAALSADPRAADTFERLSPSQRGDYLEWITGCKRAATRERRIAQAVEWLAEGKKRDWKYKRPARSVQGQPQRGVPSAGEG